MKTKLFGLMLFVASMLGAQNKLTVVVDGIENIKGHLMLSVQDSVENRVSAMMQKIENETVTLVFDSIVPGRYAVSVYQDENDNRKLDTGVFGIPKEKYGFSNNVRGKMGVPAFKERLFKVEEDTVIYITLQ
ncbi:MAG: DUF2141 domain-containing protein [Tannerella sp.]|jgi:uncharacterized protein (DUF2141 family)|nr:DUF2141 domain-containing protein [Tannerella sp.]